MRLIPILAIVTLSVALRAADKEQPLNVKIGLWEVTTTVTTSEEIPIPAGLLEKLTPEQRARAEECMKARSSDPPTAVKRKYCLTREQLNIGATFGHDRKSCTRSILASTSDRLEMRIECATQPQQKEERWNLTDRGHRRGKRERLSRPGDRPKSSLSMFTATKPGRRHMPDTFRVALSRLTRNRRRTRSSPLP